MTTTSIELAGIGREWYPLDNQVVNLHIAEEWLYLEVYPKSRAFLWRMRRDGRELQPNPFRTPGHQQSLT
jgi:hypothetical protein